MSKALYVQDGKTINYKNISDKAIPYGEVIVLTDRIGIAATDIPVGAVGALDVSGVYELNAENTAAFTIGQTVYWDADKMLVTATKPASNIMTAGWVIEPKAQATTRALVKL